jgi:hypothetical protein
MRPLLLAAMVFAGLGMALWGQSNALPRLAVVTFTINDSGNAKLVRDVVAIRNQVQARLVTTGRYEVIARDEIDKLLETQQIQVSSISSRENIEKLQLTNIKY